MITITGNDATMLSFVARNGALSAAEFKEISPYLSPAGRRVVKLGPNGKTARKMRELARENSLQFL